jgi:hypothetical protein
MPTSICQKRAGNSAKQRGWKSQSREIRHNPGVGMLQSIFSSAARLPVRAVGEKKFSEAAPVS